MHTVPHNVAVTHTTAQYITAAPPARAGRLSASVPRQLDSQRTQHAQPPLGRTQASTRSRPLQEHSEETAGSSSRKQGTRHAGSLGALTQTQTGHHYHPGRRRHKRACSTAGNTRRSHNSPRPHRLRSSAASASHPSQSRHSQQAAADAAHCHGRRSQLPRSVTGVHGAASSVPAPFSLFLLFLILQFPPTKI
ncbi:hypothetical protein TcG_01435 [Trypanosoma cruzi]|nr:hypothetical protein TcG_01435 [Trypanosoma cruzi]